MLCGGGARRGNGWTGSPSAGEWQAIADTTRRGYTGHEALDNVLMVHMNGRVYDPAIGRFLSADPYIDGADSSQGWNRYSYVRNNPLKYTDPSGYALHLPWGNTRVQRIDPSYQGGNVGGMSANGSGGAIPPAPPLGSGPFTYRITHMFWVNDWIDSNSRSWLVDLSNSGGRFVSSEGHASGGNTEAQTAAANSEAQATHVEQQVFVGPVEDPIPCVDQASSAASGLIAAGGLMATVADVVGEVEWNSVVRTVGRNLGVATTIAGGLADASEGRVLTSVVGVSLGLGSAVASFYGFPVAATALSFSALAYGVGSMFLESEESRACP